MSAPGFWDHQERAQQVIARLKTHKALLDPFAALERELEDARTLAELAEQENDDQSFQEAATILEKLGPRFESFTLKTLLSSEYDAGNAYMTINAGEGGTDSCDFVAILLRMYTMWCQDQGFAVELLDELAGEEAGLKSVTAHIRGPFAFGLLQSERGVHRLVRFSPFNADNKRQTSFAAVDVTPEYKDVGEIEILDKDLRLDTYSASGPGGQHVNKTASAVRITHLPTNTVVQCQSDRSQHKNRAQAMRLLAMKLKQRELDKRAAEDAARHAGKGKAGFGTRIRSYFFHPETRVKDERTGWGTGKVQAVIDGGLDGLIEAFLRWNYEQQKR